MQRHLLPLLLLLLSSSALVAVVWFWPETPPAMQARLPAEAAQGGDFTLAALDGPFKLANLRGQVVLLYFGYRLCPDICPTNLAGMARAFDLLTPDELAEVHGVFVSLDPERDSLTDLQAYTAYFHPRIRGVTGSVHEVSAIAGQYGVAWRKVATESALGYMLDHSAHTYLIAPDGSIGARLAHATEPSVIADKIRAFLKASAPIESAKSPQESVFSR